MFQSLQPQAPDPLLSLIALHRADPRTDKVDLGVGGYRDAFGTTPVMAAVKEAERRLVETQATKSYLGPEGDIGFLELVGALIGLDDLPRDRVVAVQTPGGTGALRLAADIAKRAHTDMSVTLGLPSWPIHASIFDAALVRMSTYAAFDVATQSIGFDAVLEAIRRTPRGHLVLLHGCCHNPTGADFTDAEWTAIAGALGSSGAVPMIDLAYHGLGDGLDEDGRGLRMVIDNAPRAMIAYSCDKNFGLYRERTGALFILCETADEAGRVRSNAHAIARANWSMPPDHGAAIVRTILTDPAYARRWRDELDGMRPRLLAVRQGLASAGLHAGIDLSDVARQRGLFSLLAISKDHVAALRERFGVYAAGSGRINVAGMSLDDCIRVAQALAAVKH